VFGTSQGTQVQMGQSKEKKGQFGGSVKSNSQSKGIERLIQQESWLRDFGTTNVWDCNDESEDVLDEPKV